MARFLGRVANTRQNLNAALNPRAAFFHHHLSRPERRHPQGYLDNNKRSNVC